MPTIELGQINWLAVIVAALATFMLGGAWYSALFAAPWKVAHGFTDERVKELQARRPPAVFFSTMILCYVVVSLAMAILVQWCSISSIAGGAWLGLLVGLGLAAPIGLTSHLASDVKTPGYLIDTSYQLIYCIMTGAILGAWH